MLGFIFHKPVVNRAQKFINKLDPKVNIQLPMDLPLPSVRMIKNMATAVSKINGFESGMCQLTDVELKTKTDDFRRRYQESIQGKRKELADIEEKLKVATYEEREDVLLKVEKIQEEFKKEKQKVLDDILPEAFAVVRETAKRTVGMRHYDVQMVGGMVLHNGIIAEMATGEGKTLVGTLPAYLNALTGDGVHIVTVNDYLATRDREWMGPIFEFLGLVVGVIKHDEVPQDRKAAYNCDITYGTNNEFGFDYLRDNMVNFKDEMTQRMHHFAVVDEVDCILIDEARTPLIISGPAEESTDKYYKANEISKQLKGRRVTDHDEIEAKHKEIDLTEGFDYTADEKSKSVSLTEAGEEKTAKMFGVDNLHEMSTIEYRHHILQALRAKEFFKRDVDYVVRDGQVIIVDEFTGRMMPGRRWSDGLHQAVESREGIKIERENQTLATVTFQNYFRMYEKLSGMTGTAHTEATEFEEIYKLECVVMPPNRVLQRTNNPDAVFRSSREKYNAVIEEIERLHEKGQPVLVGTISIEKSEFLSSLLKQRAIPHQVLNAKYHEMEANIVAQAGRYKAITIATNMAGRGTDIVLGGNADYLAKSLAEEKGKDKDDQEKEKMIAEFLDQFSEQCKEESKKVIEVGGLFVLGTERHESRRIDNQLRGRSGRQGDPGASKFFVSMEDDLMRLFASEKVTGVLNSLGMEDGLALESGILSKTIEMAQKRVESHNFEIRKHLLDLDDVMNKQREVIYRLRREILESEDVKDRVLEAIQDTSDFMIRQFLSTEELNEFSEEKGDIEALDEYLKAKFNLVLGGNKSKIEQMEVDRVIDMVWKQLQTIYGKKEVEIGDEHLRHLERILFLHTIDAKWKDHLYAMDQLKEGIGLRAMGQRDPIIEYKREGFEMFEMMFNSIGHEVAETIFKIQPVAQLSPLKGVFSSLPQEYVHNEFNSLSGDHVREQGQAGTAMGQPPAAQEPPPPAQPYQKDSPKIGRNDPCSCGSGKKYKKCCGR